MHGTGYINHGDETFLYNLFSTWCQEKRQRKNALWKKTPNIEYNEKKI